MSNEQSSLAQRYANLKSLWAGMWQYKRVALFTSFFVTAVGLFFVGITPNKYEASATVLADTRSILKPLLNGIAVQNDTDDGIQSVAMTLLSRDNLEFIALRADLDIKAGKSPEAYEAMLKKLKNDIQIGGSKKSNIYTITYRHENPQTAERVVTLALKRFFETVESQSRLDTNSATGFLETNISERKTELEASEKRLADFKQKYQDKLPQQGTGYYASIATLKKEIDELDGLIMSKATEVQTLKNTFIPKKTASGMAVVSTPFDARLAELKQTMDAASLQYTEKHPIIIEISSQIKELERQRSEAEQSILASASKGELTSSGNGERDDILQKFALDVSQRESELNVLKSKRERLNEQLSALNEKMQEVPRIEAELTSLQRDYNVSKDMYDKLVGRLEQAKLSENASSETKDIKFKTLEPPRIPKTPAGPLRPVFYVVVFLFAIVSGLLIAFIKHQLNPRIMDLNQLKRCIIKAQDTDDTDSRDGAATTAHIRVLGSLVHLDHERVSKTIRRKNALFVAGYGLIFFMTISFIGADMYLHDAPLVKIKHMLIQR